MDSLLILGGGVFGLSTALAAISQGYRVTLIDDGDEDAASRGLGRIFRTQYPRREYENLAVSARVRWEGEYGAYFHERTKVIRNLDGAEGEDLGAAWIEAHKVMREAREVAKQRGVGTVTDTVACLRWDGARCIGAVTRGGQTFHADTVVLALGAALAKFLADEGRAINDICEPIVVPWVCVHLNDEQYEAFRTKPIMVLPGRGEYLPPNDDKLLWVNNPKSARVPDVSALKGTPERTAYFNETKDLFHSMLPELGDAPVVSFKYCMDSITPSQDFLIGPVPNTQGLFIAGGGSCHSFKFFPVLGDVILPILRGEETEYSGIWAYERHEQSKKELEQGGGDDQLVHGELRPRRTYPNE